MQKGFVRAGALGFGLGLALAAGGAQAEQHYEIWALDQGTNIVHVYDAGLEEVARIELGEEDVRTAHMIDFTSDHAYAFIASTGSADVTVIRTEDRAVADIIFTGLRSHMATVAPDDSRALVAVMGGAGDPYGGELVELLIDADNEAFEVGRSLVIAEDPLVEEQIDRFSATRAICQEFTADGRYAYVTLGPGLDDGGLVILDMESFELVEAFPPDELQVNCGTVRTRDGRFMFVNGGGPEVGVFYVFDTETHEVVHQDDTRGYDAHGVWPTPDGDEVWMVNRVTENAIVIDASTFEILAELDAIGTTPDIIAMSPDGDRAFITLRGPEPVTAPHVAVGETPGFAVVDIEARELVEIVQPNPDEPGSDFHGIGVRVLHD